MRVVLALAVVGVCLAACGDSGDNTGGGSSRAASKEPASKEPASGQPVHIVLRMNLPDGEVLPESRIGDEPFCPGGTTHDEHGSAALGLVVSTFDCPGGQLTITFSPTQNSLEQSSAWRVVEGTGSFAGWHGDGQMESEFDPENREQGEARFTGTIGP